MVTTFPSQFATVDASLADVPALWRVADQHETTFDQSETGGEPATVLSPREILDETVEILPLDSVKRHGAERHGIITESIYVHARTTIRIHYRAHMHLLVLYEDGARREGETSIDKSSPSRLRKLTNKLTFVPAWHRFDEWHETSTAVRVTYLYLNPAKFQKAAHGDQPHTPRVHFEDSTLWATAIKLKSVLDGGSWSGAYLEALVNVLAHELSQSGQQPAGRLPANRGGLASWQARAVAAYIEEHLSEQISLMTLARIARLSTHHFCRAFKKSFNAPPHKYHQARRIQQAKLLLSERGTSITEVSIILGYSCPSSFSDTFRKTTGQSPSQFRKSLR
jgi:AraC family transcriptional regulator